MDSLGPAGNLVIDNVDFLELFLQHLEVLPLLNYFVVHLHDVFILELAVSVLLVSGVGLGVDLQFVEASSQLIIIFFQLVRFAITLADIHEQLGVGLLTDQELLNHFLDIGHSSRRLNGFEGVVDLRRFSHFFLHLFPHELVPQLLYVESLPHFKFGRIFVLVCSSLSDLLVTFLSLDPFLN